jgi:FkbM family methyltransferase
MMAIRACKQVVQWLLSKVGYQLIRQDQFGFDAIADIKTLCCEKDAKVIFDVGANEGQTMATFRRQFPNASIYCFEPYKQAFEILQSNAGNNPRINLYNVALGEDDRTATLFCNRSSQTNSLLKNSKDIERFAPKEWIDPIGVVDVQVCKLDTFCKNNEIKTIDLLKIDSQGDEANVLVGASELLKSQRIRLIYLEVLFVPYYEGQAFFEQVYLKLRSHSYKLVGLYNQSRHSDMSLKWCDALFMLAG